MWYKQLSLDYNFVNSMSSLISTFQYYISRYTKKCVVLLGSFEKEYNSHIFGKFQLLIRGHISEIILKRVPCSFVSKSNNHLYRFCLRIEDSKEDDLGVVMI